MLAAWDGHADVASRGAVLWRETWSRLAAAGVPWTVPFDPADPVNTPRGLDGSDPKVTDALRGAVEDLRAKGIALGVPLGDKQAEPRGGERIGIPGCSEGEGCFNIISTRRDEQGDYDPFTGSSFVMAAGFDAKGRPSGSSILSYSQSENPSSPYYADQTRLFSQEQWLPMRFTERADQGGPGLLEAGGDRPPVKPDARGIALVVVAVSTLQVGAAFAVTLFDEVGTAGAALLRLGIAALVLLAIWRPRLAGHPRADVLVAVAFGIALGTMNWAIYAAMERIPIGVAVTIEFAGPLGLAVALSRRAFDLVWVALAAAGILLLTNPFGASDLDRRGDRARAARGRRVGGLHPDLRAHGDAVPGRPRAGDRDGRRARCSSRRPGSPRAARGCSSRR